MTKTIVTVFSWDTVWPKYLLK